MGQSADRKFPSHHQGAKSGPSRHHGFRPRTDTRNILAAEANPNVRSWQADYALIAEDGSYGSWIAVAPGTDSRRILAENLIPGRMYAFRLRSIGGTTGCSDWSNTVTHRAA